MQAFLAPTPWRPPITEMIRGREENKDITTETDRDRPGIRSRDPLHTSVQGAHHLKLVHGCTSDGHLSHFLKILTLVRVGL